MRRNNIFSTFKLNKEIKMFLEEELSKKDEIPSKELINKKENKETHNLCKCGKTKFAHSKRCQYCYFSSLRKIKNIQLKKDIKKRGLK